MKANLLLLLLFLGISNVSAQMDDKFYFPRKEMQPIGWKHIENIQLHVKDDTLTALVMKPEKTAETTILFFHGTGGNISTYTHMTIPLVKAGYQVVMIDFRGYGKSTGIPTHKNIAEDGQLFFDLLLSKKEIGKTHILLYGASMGTQIATHLASKNQNRIKGLILDGTISSFSDIASFYAPEYKELIEKTYVSPYAAKEDIKMLKNIPKLFIHSKEDKEVPFEQGLKVYDAAPAPKLFFEYSGAHLEALKTNSEPVISEIGKLLTQ